MLKSPRNLASIIKFSAAVAIAVTSAIGICALPAIAAPTEGAAPVKAAPTEADLNAAKDASLLRICAAADELPYSHRDKSGFENKIAEAIAEAMGRKAHFVWNSKSAIYAVRDQLNIKMCDAVIGLDTGDDRVLSSRAYYRAPYVFVQNKASKLKIENWESPDLALAEKISFVPGTPGQVMLTKLDLFNKHFNYMHSLTNFQDRRNKYTRVPPQRMVGEVADGTAELAIAFAPEIARFVKANDKLKMTVIPDNNVRVDGERVPHHFDQSVGVRKEDKDLLAAIDAAIEKARPKIEALLKEEGIPLLSPTPPRT